MFQVIFFSVVALLVVIAILLNDANRRLKKYYPEKSSDYVNDLRPIQYSLFALAGFSLIVYFLYPKLQEAKLEDHLLEWINLVVRWAHVVLGIAWIGASFYFIFLENSLNRTKDLRDELAGNLWAIHGGGFYYVEKYKNAPPVMPQSLHWFKYEAYFTWLTGFLMLTLVYYMNAKSFMIDPAVSNISTGTAILIGLGSLVVGWIIYDLMCRSPLLSKPKLFGITGFIILTIISYILSKYLSGRAAFIHVGALLGTIMSGNVFFVIIPSQKALVAAAKKNLPPDPWKGKYAGLRSLHNNYITLPVVFVMISNHFPGTFAPSYNWIILGLLTLGSVSVRHFINMYEKGRILLWFLVLALIILISLVYITKPASIKVDNTPVKFSEVQPIIQKRCLSCHSTNPTDDVQKVPPNGIIFETPNQIAQHSDRILFRVVQTKTMPQGNKTGITEEERVLIGRWIEQGAKL